MDLTVYAWGNGASLEQTFLALKFLSKDTYYLEATIYTIALLITYVKDLKGMNKEPILKELVKTLVVAQILVVLFINQGKTNVVIEDEVTGQVYTVSNVATGTAIVKSLSSQFERDLTKWLEQGFSTPNSLNLSITGLGFTMFTTIESLDATSRDVNVVDTFNSYFHNCIKNDLINRNKTIQGLHSSGDLMSDLAPTVEFETMIYTTANPNGLQVSCSDAWADIKTRIPVESQKYIENDLVSKLKLDSSKIADGLAEQGNLFYGISKTGKQYIEQEMLKNLITEGQLHSAKITGGDTLTAVYEKTLAERATYKQWRLSGEQAVENLPMVRNVYDILFLSALPLLALFSASFMNIKFLLVGGSMMLSLALWQPLGTILNYHYLTGLEDYAKSLAHLGDYINKDKGMLVAEKAQAQLAFMQSIYQTLPLLAMAMLMGGGYALTKGMTAGTGTTSGVNSTVEDTAKANTNVGNSTVDNINGGNTNLNKQDVISNGQQITNAGGALNTQEVKQTESGTAYTANETYGTHSGNMQNVGSATIGADGNLKGVQSQHLQESINQSDKQALTQMSEKVQTEATEFTNAISKDIASNYSTGTSEDNVKSLQQSYGVSESEAQTMDKSIQKAKTESFVSSLSQDEQQQLIKDLTGKVGATIDSGDSVLGGLLQKGAGFSMYADGSYSYRDVDNNTVSKKLDESQTEQMQKTFTESINNTLKEDKSLVTGLANSVTENQSNTNSETYKEAQQYKEAQTELEQYKESVSNTQESINQSGSSVSNLVLDEYNNLKYGDVYKNASNEDKLEMSMNSLDEISNPTPQVENRINRARENVYDDFKNVGSFNDNHIPKEDINTPVTTSPVEQDNKATVTTSPVEQDNKATVTTSPVEQDNKATVTTSPVEQDNKATVTTSPVEQAIGTNSNELQQDNKATVTTSPVEQAIGTNSNELQQDNKATVKFSDVMSLSSSPLLLNEEPKPAPAVEQNNTAENKTPVTTPAVEQVNNYSDSQKKFKDSNDFNFDNLGQTGKGVSYKGVESVFDVIEKKGDEAIEIVKDGFNKVNDRTNEIDKEIIEGTNNLKSNVTEVVKDIPTTVSNNLKADGEKLSNISWESINKNALTKPITDGISNNLSNTGAKLNNLSLEGINNQAFYNSNEFKKSQENFSSNFLDKKIDTKLDDLKDEIKKESIASAGTSSLEKKER